MKKMPPIVCPKCQTSLDESLFEKSGTEVCSNCNFEIKQLHGVPVLRTNDGDEELDFLQEAKSLPVQDSATLRIPFVQEALASDEPVLELGAGVDKCDLAHLVKTDAFLYSTELDCLVDAHSMPFPDNTFGYVYSLAVFEHLHSPWIAAEEIFRVLKPGGKVFVLTAFMQHMHGYPNHYFNMTVSGLERIFSRFQVLQCQPSSWTRFDEIANILSDLNELLDGVDLKWKEKSSLRSLKKGISSIQVNLPKFNEKLLHGNTPRDGAWAKIAPAIELEAKKPK